MSMYNDEILSGKAKVVFEALGTAQTAANAGDMSLMYEIENRVVPKNRVILTPEQLIAEEFNDKNYQLLTVGKNKFYTIINPLHRLYHLDVVSCLVEEPYKDCNGSIRIKNRLFYIDREVVGFIRGKSCKFDKNGYPLASSKLLHQTITAYKYVHHKNFIRHDDYLANLESSDAFLNSQDKVTTSLGLANIDKNPNFRTGTIKLLCVKRDSKSYVTCSEYLIAAINKYLIDICIHNETYHNLDDFKLNQVAQYTTKLTALRADVAYQLYMVFLQVLDCRNDYNSMLTVLANHNIPLKKFDNYQGMILIDNDKLMERFKKQGLFCFSNCATGKDLGDICKKFYNHKGDVLIREIKKD